MPWSSSRRAAERRGRLTELTGNAVQTLQRQLSRSLSATFALASLLRQHGHIEDFDSLAAEMIASYGGISCLQLAPGGVISHVYPLAGHEKAIGHDLLGDPARRTEAQAAIDSRTLTLAGPFELIQGGVAVIGRYPVFIKKATGEEGFWGFSIVLIRLPELMKAANLQSLVRMGYDYELWRVHPDTGERAVFSHQGATPLRTPVNYSFPVPNGQWTLSVAPRTPPGGVGIAAVGYAVNFAVAATVAILIFLLLRRSEVQEARGRELAAANDRLSVEIADRRRAEEEREEMIGELRDALAKVKTLSGLLPICSYCKNIRDDQGYWHQIEAYIRSHSDVNFSHGMCDDCLKTHHPRIWRRMQETTDETASNTSDPPTQEA